MSGSLLCHSAALLVIVSLPGLTHAQLCRGHPDLEQTPIQLAGRAAAYTHAHSLGGALTVGGRGFATVQGERVVDPEQHASTFDAGLHAGYELPLGGARRASICPSIGVTRSDGPSEYLLTDSHFRRWQVGVGLDASWAALGYGPVRLVPTAGARLFQIQIRTQIGNEAWSASDVYQRVDLGLGIVLAEIVSVRPGLSIPLNLADAASANGFAAPFGREERELGFEVAITFGFRVRSVSR